MNKNVKRLLELIKENPDLPIVPLVDSDVIPDDSCNSWLGEWGRAEVTEYVMGRERIWFKDDDPEDVIFAVRGYDFWDNLPTAKVESEFNALPWIKCIVVYITS